MTLMNHIKWCERAINKTMNQAIGKQFNIIPAIAILGLAFLLKASIPKTHPTIINKRSMSKRGKTKGKLEINGGISQEGGAKLAKNTGR